MGNFAPGVQITILRGKICTRGPNNNIYVRVYVPPHRRAPRNPGDPRFTPTARHPRGNAASDRQQPQSLPRTVSIIRGDRRSFNIYMYILVLIPSGALWLCLKYHEVRWFLARKLDEKCHFPAGILNTIEKVRSRIAKVTCFTVENGPPSRPPRKWQHYRGFDHLGRWGP